MQSSAAPESITELYDRFRRPAFSLARRIVRDDVLAEDVLREAFLSVWREPAATSGGTAAARLMATVHRTAVDAARRAGSQRSREAGAVDEVSTAPAAPTQEVGDAVCDRAVVERIRAALAVLPATQRRALGLAYYSGFTQREIAALTEASLGTVKTGMRTGMGQLRSALHEITGTAPGGPALADA